MLAPSHAARPRTPRSELIAPPLSGGARVDVCIAGAGLAGLVAAYMLARDKRSVMVLEEGLLGGPEAPAEVAHLASRIEQPFATLERVHGAEGARLAAQSYAAAIDTLEAIVRREHIACDFERLDGYRFASPGDTRDDLEAEVEAAWRAGMTDVELVSEPPVEGGLPGPCVRYPAQAQLQPQKLATGLGRAIAREGGRVHCEVRAHSVESGRPSSLLTVAGHRIEADVIVMPSSPLAPPRIAHVLGVRVPRGSVTRAVYWEHTLGGTRFARLRPGAALGEVLLVGGTADEDGLADWARARFPRSSEILQRFSGEAPRATDLFAFVGEGRSASDSVYLGASGWGTAMTRIAIAGMAIRDFVEAAHSASPADPGPSACYTVGEASL